LPSPRIRLLRSASTGTEVTVEAGAEHAGDAADAAMLDAVLAESEARAVDLLRDAEDEAVSIRERAYIEGRAEGEQAGIADGRAGVVTELQALQTIGRQAAAIREAVLRNSEGELVELAAEAARAVLGEAIDRDPELVTVSVQRALERAMGMNVLRIRVHPHDASVTSAYLANSPVPISGAWDVAPDGAINVGGCIVDIEGGEIDARLDVQFDAVLAALRELIPFAPPAATHEDWLRAA
jgi:flagellar biosynthesis/type III secretory pathway protein FliH